MARQETDWEIYVLEFARNAPGPWVNLVSGMYGEPAIELPYSFILALNGGRRVLVDTGFMRGAFHRKAAVPHWVSPLRMLAEFGLAAADITDIFVTHCHFDHMGSIAEFPNARLYVQRSELLSWYEAVALPPQFGHLTAIIDPDDMRAALEASFEHRMTLIDGDRDDVLPGIHVRLGSGHTIGQQFVILQSRRGRLVISGDCVYTGRQITGLKGNGVYQPLNNAVGSVWDQLRTIDRINAEIGGDLGRLIILHDTERWPDLPVVKEIEGFRIVRAD
jgi:glyoxylase-like metal-dependent hydrolase (beta-lactamase superfamily II)